MLKTMEEQIAHPGVDIIDTFSSPYFTNVRKNPDSLFLVSSISFLFILPFFKDWHRR